MNNKIAFPRLAALLADKSGRSKRFSEDFLRELFTLIGEQLEAGESVKVKGFGTFRLLRVEPRKSVDVTTGLPMEISGHSKVTFTPAKELAEAVNAPFEAFTAVEIGDDVDINSIAEEDEILIQDDSQEILLNSSDELSPVAELAAKNSESEVECQPTEINEPEVKEPEVSKQEEVQPEEDYDEEKTDSSELPVRVSPKALTSKAVCDGDDIEVADVVHANDSSFQDDWSNGSYPHRNGYLNKINWRRALLVCFGCAALGVIVTFVIWSLLTKPDFSNVENKGFYSSKQDHDKSSYDIDVEGGDGQTVLESDVPVIEIAEEESGIEESVATAPSDVVVYDTIGKSRYLTTMAKDHYGDNKLWPYIYEENKDRIGHPDRIRPGTPIIIPKLSKYGVNPSDPKDIEKANKLGVEIYARYGKKI